MLVGMKMEFKRLEIGQCGVWGLKIMQKTEFRNGTERVWKTTTFFWVKIMI